jgi:hypothetical protein
MNKDGRREERTEQEFIRSSRDKVEREKKSERAQKRTPQEGGQ